MYAAAVDVIPAYDGIHNASLDPGAAPHGNASMSASLREALLRWGFANDPLPSTLGFGKAFAKPALSKISSMGQRDMRALPG